MSEKQTEALKAIASAHTNADVYTREYIITNFINPARAALAEQPAQGCEFCSHPLYAGTKCKNCGHEQPAIKQDLIPEQPAQTATYTCGVCGVSMQMEQPAQPQQEPVSWDRFMSVEKELQDMTAEFMRVAKELAAIKTQQQEPVAWMHTNAIGHVYFRKNPQDKTLNPVPLYTSPPARKPWVGLTDWIDPNDKTQKQYLPHIGEPVLFCHSGKTYCGHHNGGSFQNQDEYFNTWECRWMYLPTAHGITGDK